ncbi:MAG: diguanylate cyclase [Kangiellaceae bacterium]|nr:diguanylate cyclase [Kangiellaceae bacterium]MCW8997910.1 diguanylate cyclase [Kangiellaceae bacterium]
MKALKYLLVITSIVFCCSILAQEPPTAKARLELADKLKSADGAKFVQILSGLESEFDSLSILEKYYFLYLKGYEKALKGDLNAAEKNYRHVFDNTRDTVLKYRTALSLVNVTAFKREWADGLKYISYIDKHRESISDPNIRHQGLIAVAIFYDEIEYHSVTLDFVKNVLNESQDGRNLCLARGLYFKSQLRLNQEIESISHIKEAIEACDATKEIILSNVIRAHLAHYYLENGDSIKALELLKDNISTVEQTNYQLLIIEFYSLLSSAYFTQNNHQDSKRYALLTIELEKVVKDIKPIANAYNILHKISLQNNQLGEAISYLKSYFDAEKKHFEEINGRQLAVESAKRQSAEKDAKIDSLNKQNQILKLEKELSEETAMYNRWVIGLLVVCVTLLVAWTVYIRKAQRKLKYLAEYDSLTGICNRAHFTQSAEAALNLMVKSDREVSLILFDLDHFKKINDSYGHPAGDFVLKEAANVCNLNIRKIDIIGRVGGEEFAILLPGCEIDQAVKVAEECRLRITEIDTSDSGFDFNVSASFGIANTQGTGYELKDLVAQADEAMYLAKRRGRNQVVVQPKE